MLADHRRGAVLESVQTLFDLGTVGGLSDAELLGLFADRRDEQSEPAFAALVDRHGPTVLRVCRSILRDEHDAQDAFQATFLVLVRRAALIRKRDSLGSWLHGVALRVSACARTAIARRRRHEQHAAEIASPCVGEAAESREIAAVLHKELARLPERYRAAIILCYLDGLSCEAAAQRLGWPVGTVKSRLSRGRERLLRRLIVRGFGPEESSGSGSERTSVVPAPLASETVKSMLQIAAGRSMSGPISATALSWALKTLRSMQVMRVVALAGLFFIGISVLGAVVWATPIHELANPTRAPKIESSKRKRDRPAHADRKGELTTVRVVDLRGEVVPNATVRVVNYEFNARPREYRTDGDGRCQVVIDPRSQGTELHARTNDQNLGWASIMTGGVSSRGTDKNPVEITLLPLSHHVEGSIRDTAGEPIGGVQVRVLQLTHEANGTAAGEGGFLGSAVTDFAEGKPMADIVVQSNNPARPRSGHSQVATTTDASGNFELFVPPGSADVYCRGHYQHRTVFADRDPDPIRFEKARGPNADYHEKRVESVEIEARIRIRMATGNDRPRNERDLTGQVCDKNGLPIAGVHVSYNREKLVSGATDRTGEFRLKGLSVGPFSLNVERSGYAPGRATIPADAREVDLTLPHLPEVNK